jgi:hypothetical protein
MHDNPYCDLPPSYFILLMASLSFFFSDEFRVVVLSNNISLEPPCDRMNGLHAIRMFLRFS